MINEASTFLSTVNNVKVPPAKLWFRARSHFGSSHFVQTSVAHAQGGGGFTWSCSCCVSCRTDDGKMGNPSKDGGAMPTHFVFSITFVRRSEWHKGFLLPRDFLSSSPIIQEHLAFDHPCPSRLEYRAGGFPQPVYQDCLHAVSCSWFVTSISHWIW